MAKVSKKVLSKFETSALKNILSEFFSVGIYADFFNEVLDSKSIEDTDKFFREFAIEHIRDEVTFEDLVESGWCYDDEMDDEI